jgi:hypothetical protein
MPELRHQLSGVVGLYLAIVAIGGRWFVGVAEASQVWRDQGEVLGEEWEKSVPIKGVFRCSCSQNDELIPIAYRIDDDVSRRISQGFHTVEEQKCGTLPGGDVMLANAIHPSAAMLDPHTGVIVHLGSRRHIV